MRVAGMDSIRALVRRALGWVRKLLGWAPPEGAVEIERKFLVQASHPHVQEILRGVPVLIRQGYIFSGEKGVVRVRTAGSKGYLTVKGPSVGIKRPEFEYEVPLAHANEMLDSMCDFVLEKVRYKIPIRGGLVVELDKFVQTDLLLAEIELPSEDATFEKPEWFGSEVSEDPAYFNNNIADRIRSGGQVGLSEVLPPEEMHKQHRMMVDSAKKAFEEVVGDQSGRKMTVGKHEACNHVHLRSVLEEADEKCPRASDTIRWLLWHNVLHAQRMSRFAGASRKEIQEGAE